MNQLRLSLLAAGLCLVAASGLHAQTLLNGGFEDPALTPGSFAAGSGANWTATGSAVLTTNGVGYGTTPYGNQWEFLNTGATDTQTISSAFALNQVYTLSLAAADVTGITGNQLTVTISGGATATATFTIPTRPGGIGAGALTFAPYTLSFTPTTGTAVTVTFTNSNAQGNGIAVDNVRLTVPEPSVWALLSLGVVLSGLVSRRRRSQI